MKTSGVLTQAHYIGFSLQLDSCSLTKQDMNTGLQYSVNGKFTDKSVNECSPEI